MTDLVKGYTAKPVKYLEIVEPISDFRELRKVGLWRVPYLFDADFLFFSYSLKGI